MYVYWVTTVNISGLWAIPTNFQKDRVCVLAATRKRQVAPEHLLQTHSTFSKSVMVTMGVSKLGHMDGGPDFCRCWNDDQWLMLPWGASDSKANACHAWEVEICGEFFIFQQGNIAVHWVRKTINLQERHTAFI